MNETLIQRSQRIKSIDVLRGIIMVIMVLDHARDFFTNIKFDPLDLSKTSFLLFFTRWITHFCAPVFVFLSGTSAYLSLSKHRDKTDAALFLVKRGLWLILLEMTVITFGWSFDTGLHTVFLAVIWAIGWSMIALATLIFFKTKYIALIGFLIIAGHHLTDHFSALTFGSAKYLWMLLHEQGRYIFHDRLTFIIIYPLLPWVGVIALGYASGSLFTLEKIRRKSAFLKIGLAVLLLFAVLRFFNIYGDPAPWQSQTVWWKSMLSFINLSKYPASLLYLLLTLGIAVLLLAFLENKNNKLTEVMAVYGNVPLFYYILHLYLLHLLQFLIAIYNGFTISSMLKFTVGGSEPSGWGFDLPVVYLSWVIIVVALYLPCRWYKEMKRSKKSWWHSYI